MAPPLREIKNLKKKSRLFIEYHCTWFNNLRVVESRNFFWFKIFILAPLGFCRFGWLQKSPPTHLGPSDHRHGLPHPCTASSSSSSSGSSRYIKGTEDWREPLTRKRYWVDDERTKKRNNARSRRNRRAQTRKIGNSTMEIDPAS